MLDLTAKKDIANEILSAYSACAELKAAAQNFLDAAGTPDEQAAGRALVIEAKDCICPIDGAIGFLSSDKAKEIFGEAVAAEKLTSVLESKAGGEIYCNCPGCAAAKKVIENEVSF